MESLGTALKDGSHWEVLGQGSPSVCRAVLSHETVKACGCWMCGTVWNPQNPTPMVTSLSIDGPDSNRNWPRIPLLFRKEMSLGAEVQFPGLLLWQPGSPRVNGEVGGKHTAASQPLLVVAVPSGKGGPSWAPVLSLL